MRGVGGLYARASSSDVDGGSGGRVPLTSRVRRLDGGAVGGRVRDEIARLDPTHAHSRRHENPVIGKELVMRTHSF